MMEHKEGVPPLRWGGHLLLTGDDEPLYINITITQLLYFNHIQFDALTFVIVGLYLSSHSNKIHKIPLPTYY